MRHPESLAECSLCRGVRTQCGERGEARGAPSCVSYGCRRPCQPAGVAGAGSPAATPSALWPPRLPLSGREMGVLGRGAAPWRCPSQRDQGLPDSVPSFSPDGSGSCSPFQAALQCCRLWMCPSEVRWQRGIWRVARLGPAGGGHLGCLSRAGSATWWPQAPGLFVLPALRAAQLEGGAVWEGLPQGHGQSPGALPEPAMCPLGPEASSCSPTCHVSVFRGGSKRALNPEE